MNNNWNKYKVLRRCKISNEIIIFEFLIKKLGAKTYDIEYLNFDGNIVRRSFKIEYPFRLPKPRRICYGPLNPQNTRLSIFFEDKYGNIISDSIDLIPWAINIEGADPALLYGWIACPENFIIRPFNISINSIDVSYDIKFTGKRSDAAFLSEKCNIIGHSIEIILGSRLKKQVNSISLGPPSSGEVMGQPKQIWFESNIYCPEWSDILGITPKTIFNQEDHNPQNIDRKQSTKYQIAVIMPIYNGFTETLEAIESTAQGIGLCSPKFKIRFLLGLDNPSNLSLNEEIKRRYENRPEFVIIENEVNLGFVGNCNNLFKLVRKEEEILLLNSDIIAPKSNWIERLFDAGTSSANVGTATPLSNRASIFSFPKPNTDQGNILNLSVDDQDNLLLRSNNEFGKYIKVPTCHGFCVMIFNSRLKLSYLFDKDFGKGYGEENELSLRIRKMGFENVACTDVYIYHHESISFATEKLDLMNTNHQKLLNINSNYDAAVSIFCKQDPIRIYRNRAILKFLQELVLTKKSILHISHFRGGGTNQYISNLVKTEHEFFHFGARPDKNNLGLVDLYPIIYPESEQATAPALSISEEDLFHDNLDLLNILNIRRIIFHSLIDFLPFGPKGFAKRYDSSKISSTVMVHDYHWTRDNENLLDHTHRYRGVIIDQAVNDILNLEGSQSFKDPKPQIKYSTDERVNNIYPVLFNSDQVVAPSYSARDILLQTLLGRGPEISVKYHDTSGDRLNLRRLAEKRYYIEGRNIKVGVIGAIGPNKGFQLIKRLAQFIVSSRIPIEILIIGFTCNDKAFAELANVKITGPYEHKEFHNIATAHGIDCTLFLSQCPETYSYTLSLAFENELWPFVLNIGAQAERVRTSGFGTILPSPSPKDIAETILARYTRISSSYDLVSTQGDVCKTLGQTCFSAEGS
jgi:GT2 family glycosyltransferase